MPLGEFRDADARELGERTAFTSVLPLFPDVSFVHRGVTRENRSRIPVRLARRNEIGGTEATLDASRGRERAPSSGQSSCLEVRFKHLASFLVGFSFLVRVVSRTALRACSRRKRGRRDDATTSARPMPPHDGERVRRCSSGRRPQHGRTGEKLRENPTMLTARPASDCRENGAGIQLSGIARLEGSSAPLSLARSLASALFLSLSLTPAISPLFQTSRPPALPHRSAAVSPYPRCSLRSYSLPLGCPPGFPHHSRLLL